MKEGGSKIIISFEYLKGKKLVRKKYFDSKFSSRTNFSNKKVQNENFLSKLPFRIKFSKKGFETDYEKIQNINISFIINFWSPRILYGQFDHEEQKNHGLEVPELIVKVIGFKSR